MHAMVVGIYVFFNARIIKKRVSVHQESNLGDSTMTKVMDLDMAKQFYQINKRIDELQKKNDCCSTIEAFNIINHRIKNLEEQNA